MTGTTCLLVLLVLTVGLFLLIRPSAQPQALLNPCRFPLPASPSSVSTPSPGRFLKPKTEWDHRANSRFFLGLWVHRFGVAKLPVSSASATVFRKSQESNELPSAVSLMRQSQQRPSL